MKVVKIDLTNKKPHKVIKTWVNVYPNGYACGYPSKERALNAAAVITVVEALPIEVTID